VYNKNLPHHYTICPISEMYNKNLPHHYIRDVQEPASPIYNLPHIKEVQQKPASPLYDLPHIREVQQGPASQLMSQGRLTF
jgi:hypothetical protein